MCCDFSNHMVKVRQYLQRKERELAENCGQLYETLAKASYLSDIIHMLRNIQPNMNAEDLQTVLKHLT